MEKNIKDYLHLYLGCYWSNGVIKTLLTHDKMYSREYNGFKPILRPLSSMTENECDEFGIAFMDGQYNYDCFEPDAIYGGWGALIGIKDITERINEIRKRGFDCDGLIEAGLAIDKTKIKP